MDKWEPEQSGRYWAGRRVAVTGATGFVGHHLAMRLVQEGANVNAIVRASSSCQRLLGAGIRCVQASLDNQEALVQAVRGCEFVFHVAGAVDFHDDWNRLRLVNIEGTRNAIEASRLAGVRRLIYTSSIVAVGASSYPRTLDETARWNLASLRVPYVTTKRAAEELALAATGPHMEVVAVNPASVVGPDDFTPSEFGTLCRRFWKRRIPVYFGGGNNFVDVRDVAIGHLLAAERGRAGHRYILGGTNCTFSTFFADLARMAEWPIFRVRLPVGIATMAAAIKDRLGHDNSTRPYLTTGQARLLSLFFYFDSSRARQELGFKPKPWSISLRDSYAFWMGRRSA